MEDETSPLSEAISVVATVSFLVVALCIAATMVTLIWEINWHPVVEKSFYTVLWLAAITYIASAWAGIFTW